MSYAVKEIFLTLQGEGVHAGRRAVFLRFAGCNLWTGREEDRSSAICQFCDTDFVGMNGENGGRYDAADLAAKVAALWGDSTQSRYVVITGGEPMLQVDDAIVDALHAHGPPGPSSGPVLETRKPSHGPCAAPGASSRARLIEVQLRGFALPA